MCSAIVPKYRSCQATLTIAGATGHRFGVKFPSRSDSAHSFLPTISVSLDNAIYVAASPGVVTHRAITLIIQMPVTVLAELHRILWLIPRHAAIVLRVERFMCPPISITGFAVSIAATRFTAVRAWRISHRCFLSSAYTRSRLHLDTEYPAAPVQRPAA